MPKYDLAFSRPYLNAAGFLGFAPDLHGPADLAGLGAFVTNPISLERRSPARSPRFQIFPGGFLLHTGHPNPGFRAVLKHFGPRWAASTVPVIVNLLVKGVEDTKHMARRLDEVDGVIAIEISLPPEVDAEGALALSGAAVGELPVILRLPLDRALELAPIFPHSGAAAISLGAPRGSLPDADNNLIQGRLFGPSLFPQSLATAQSLSKRGFPVIAGGGIYHISEAQALLNAGAIAVQLDAVLWRGGWET
ncbi:MAG: hypothetical protein ACM3PY_00395 [Omnitrophica WOR_2 bacterium]